MSARGIVAIATSLACLSGCSSPSTGAPTPAPATSASPAADDGGATVEPAPPPVDAGVPGTDAAALALSAGCGKPATKTGLLAPITLTVKAKSRVYHLAVPAPYDATRAYPVVFVLHGATDTTPQHMHDWFDVHKHTPPALYVYPQALKRTHKDGSGGYVTRWDLDGDEDLLFFDALVDAIGKAYCTRAGAAFATGFSSGGNFTHQLACLRRKALLAAAPVAGPGPFVSTCGGPVPIWITHDANDDALPVSGARQSRDFWLAANGCTKDLVQDTPAECKRGKTCPSAYRVTYCESVNVGHDVPAYATKEIGRFFSEWF